MYAAVCCQISTVMRLEQNTKRLFWTRWPYLKVPLKNFPPEVIWSGSCVNLQLGYSWRFVLSFFLIFRFIDNEGCSGNTTMLDDQASPSIFRPLFCSESSQEHDKLYSPEVFFLGHPRPDGMYNSSSMLWLCRRSSLVPWIPLQGGVQDAYWSKISLKKAAVIVWVPSNCLSSLNHNHLVITLL